MPLKYIALSALASRSLVTGVQVIRSRNSEIGDELHSSSQCAKLQNNFVSFTVNLCVGTPPQCFDVVADTGSNTVIVPSCVCQETAYAGCTPGEKCFEGTGKSSTFSIPKHPQLEQISFGSGTVAGAMATDVVKVGPASTTIDSGIFLMTDRAQLQIDEFEGIMGLGVPSSKGEDEKLFFEEAKIGRFSLCMADSVSGSLRMNQPSSFKNEVRQIGTYHWGLDFRGMSVGKKGASEKLPILFCDESTMKAGMDSPCGIIPDSGTTMIIGPKAQVAQLEASLCDAWPRCQQQQASGNAKAKSAAFASLLEHCSDWLHNSDGLYEMPSLFFHLRGKNGEVSMFELSAWAYIVEAQTSQGRVCESMLSHGADTEGSDYITTQNGPIWIVGTPLFYEYNVGFDMESMSVALDKESCQACEDDGAVKLIAGDLTNDLRNTGQPRSKHGIARRPQYNITRPL